MNVNAIIKEAFAITWRQKKLWLLGFLFFLGSGLSSTWQFGQRIGWDEITPIIVRMAQANVWFALLIIFSLGLALIVLTFLAEMAMVSAVARVKEHGAFGLASVWAAASSRFWPLLGARLLFVLFTFVLLAPLLLFAGLMAALKPAPFPVDESALCLPLLYFLVLFVGAMAAFLAREFADRTCVLGGQGSLKAFRQGWRILKRNLGRTIYALLLELIVELVLAAPLMIFMVGIASGTPNAPMVLLMILALLGLLAGGSMMWIFHSCFWTLLYSAAKDR